MKPRFIVLGFLVCAFGLVLAWVYFSPIGFVIDSLGFLIFLYGLFAREPYEQDSPRRPIDQSKCGNCVNFGTFLCPRKEKLLNAGPCDKFLFYSGKRNP